MTNEQIREELNRLYSLPPSPLVEREIAFLTLALHNQTKRDETKISVRISISQPVGGESCRNANSLVSKARTMEAQSGQNASR